MEVFETTKGSHPKVTHIRGPKKIIIEQDNISIDYEEGFLNKQGEFQSLGVGHILLDNKETPEEKNEAGEVVIPAQPSKFSLYVKDMNEGKNYEDTAVKYLRAELE
jgi:hypothetical protein